MKANNIFKLKSNMITYMLEFSNLNDKSILIKVNKFFTKKISASEIKFFIFLKMTYRIQNITRFIHERSANKETEKGIFSIYSDEVYFRILNQFLDCTVQNVENGNIQINVINYPSLFEFIGKLGFRTQSLTGYHNFVDHSNNHNMASECIKALKFDHLILKSVYKMLEGYFLQNFNNLKSITFRFMDFDNFLNNFKNIYFDKGEKLKLEIVILDPKGHKGLLDSPQISGKMIKEILFLSKYVKIKIVTYFLTLVTNLT